MTHYRLTYFDFDGGRAEPVRIALHAAGIDFEDVRWTFPQFQAERGSLRFNCVPVLELDGNAVTQSNAMCRYIGKLAGLYPDDDLQALYCDEVLGACEDLTNRVVATFGLEGDALKSAREELVEGWLTVYLRGLGELLARGGGEYFADKRMTMADLKVFMHTRWLQSGGLDHVPADLVRRVTPELAGHHDRIELDPRVVAYYANRA